jgi:hypothetical protein
MHNLDRRGAFDSCQKGSCVRNQSFTFGVTILRKEVPAGSYDHLTAARNLGFALGLAYVSH